MSAEDNMNKFAGNTIIIILIIFVIIFGLPLILYSLSKFLFIGKKDNDTLIDDLKNKDIDKYNELSEIYLFCSYMPFKKIFCGIDEAGMAEKAEHATEITSILGILENKKNFIVQHYEGIKANSDNLINKKFDELEPDILSILSRTLMDLDDRIQIYKKGLQHGEMFNVGHYRKPKEKVGLKEGGFISLKDIMSKVNP